MTKYEPNSYPYVVWVLLFFCPCQEPLFWSTAPTPILPCLLREGRVHTVHTATPLALPPQHAASCWPVLRHDPLTSTRAGEGWSALEQAGAQSREECRQGIDRHRRRDTTTTPPPKPVRRCRARQGSATLKVGHSGARRHGQAAHGTAYKARRQHDSSNGSSPPR